MIAPGLVLAMLLNPVVYAAAQKSPNQLPSPSSDQNSQYTQPQTDRPRSAQIQQAPGNDNAPVPPMPPLDPSELASSPGDPLPDSPGSVESAQLETQQAPVAQQSAQPQNYQSAAQQSPPAMPPPTPKEPLGAAAAETVPTMGIAASRPAGAALAPAKQRRVRTILIRMGVVVGAAAALGVTMALTEASPSKPPGAH
jgi:cytoskeletal protein RodZ